MHRVSTYEVRKLHNMPGRFDEMLARSYACRKHSLAAVTVHFWPGGRLSSRLGHGRLFLLSAACLRNFLDPGGCYYWKHLESWRSVLLQKKEKTIWPWTLIRVILLEADWYCKVAKCDFSVIIYFCKILIFWLNFPSNIYWVKAILKCTMRRHM